VPQDHDPEALVANLETIREEIGRACERSGRDPDGVRIVAAAKTVEPEAIARVRDAGVREVGENYVKELRAKRDQVDGIVWHYIGTLQSHSAHQVADLADVVETVTPGRAMTIPVLIEVDFTRERTGVAPQGVDDAADQVAHADGLGLIGLMTLPPLPSAAEDSRPLFRGLRELLEGVAARHPEATELSMGMSLDYPVAVEEGATMVRVGTALFGARRPEDTGRT